MGGCFCEEALAAVALEGAGETGSPFAAVPFAGDFCAAPFAGDFGPTPFAGDFGLHLLQVALSWGSSWVWPLLAF